MSHITSTLLTLETAGATQPNPRRPTPSVAQLQPMETWSERQSQENFFYLWPQTSISGWHAWILLPGINGKALSTSPSTVGSMHKCMCPQFIGFFPPVLFDSAFLPPHTCFHNQRPFSFFPFPSCSLFLWGIMV